MPDREKVIKGLECCLGSNDCDIEPEEDCPYKGMCLCAMALRLDVFALLKEQDGQTYRQWMIEMFHKHGRDDLIAIMVQKGEENILADVLKGQEAVVRCKDCKHWKLTSCPVTEHKLGYMPPDWFCADGEHK